MITRKEQGSATPLPTDSRGWQYVWFTVRTKQEDPTELLFILFCPLLSLASTEPQGKVNIYRSKLIKENPISFFFEGNDPSVNESGTRAKPISMNFQIIWQITIIRTTFTQVIQFIRIPISHTKMSSIIKYMLVKTSDISALVLVTQIFNVYMLFLHSSSSCLLLLLKLQYVLTILSKHRCS